MKSVLSTFLCLGLVMIGASGEDLSQIRRQMVDNLFNAYDKAFQDLDEIKKGRFGVSRNSVRKIGGHISRVDEFSMGNRHFMRSVSIVSSKGKPLIKDSLQTYVVSNWVQAPYGTHFAEKEKPWTSQLKAELTRLKSSAYEAVAAGKVPKSFNFNGATYDFRVFRLKSKACLSCHSGMKVGDPVAILTVKSRQLTRDAKGKVFP